MKSGRGSLIIAVSVLALSLWALSYLVSDLSSFSEYKRVGEPVSVFASELESTDGSPPRDLKSMFSSRTSCHPFASGGSMSIGSELLGAQRLELGYQISMNQDETCKRLCDDPISPAKHRYIDSIARDRYTVHVDVGLVGTVAAGSHLWSTDDYKFYTSFPLAYPIPNGDTLSVAVNNHIDFKLFYSVASDGVRRRVVKAELVPRSFSGSNCSGSTYILGSAPSVEYTYSVEWIQAPSEASQDTEWENAMWGKYDMESTSDKDNVTNMLASAGIVVLTGLLLATLLLGSLKRDITAYNQVPAEVELGEPDFDSIGAISDESGWKAVHGDVFRAPYKRRLLCILTGLGVHLTCVMTFSLLLSLTPMFKPHSRGSLISLLLYTFILSSGIAGYVTSRLYMPIWSPVRSDEPSATSDASVAQGKATFLLAFVTPGIVVSALMVQSVYLHLVSGSTALPLKALLALALLWIGVSVPLTYLGSSVALASEVPSWPCRTSRIPRPLPVLPFFARRRVLFPAAGLVVFSVACSQLFLVMSSVWTSPFRLLMIFGSQLVGLLLTALASCLVSIAVTYVTLTCEEYRWWWRSFMAPAFSGVWLFGISIYYLQARLHTHGFNAVLWFLVMSLAGSLMMSFITGSCGLLASIWFVRKIYSRIKAD